MLTPLLCLPRPDHDEALSPGSGHQKDRRELSALAGLTGHRPAVVSWAEERLAYNSRQQPLAHMSGCRRRAITCIWASRRRPAAMAAAGIHHVATRLFRRVRPTGSIETRSHGATLFELKRVAPRLLLSARIERFGDGVTVRTVLDKGGIKKGQQRFCAFRGLGPCAHYRQQLFLTRNVLLTLSNVPLRRFEVCAGVVRHEPAIISDQVSRLPGPSPHREHHDRGRKLAWSISVGARGARGCGIPRAGQIPHLPGSCRGPRTWGGEGWIYASGRLRKRSTISLASVVGLNVRASRQHQRDVTWASTSSPRLITV